MINFSTHTDCGVFGGWPYLAYQYIQQTVNQLSRWHYCDSQLLLLLIRVALRQRAHTPTVAALESVSHAWLLVTIRLAVVLPFPALPAWRTRAARQSYLKQTLLLDWGSSHGWPYQRWEGTIWKMAVTLLYYTTWLIGWECSDVSTSGAWSSVDCYQCPDPSVLSLWSLGPDLTVWPHLTGSCSPHRRIWHKRWSLWEKTILAHQKQVRCYYLNKILLMGLHFQLGQ